MDSHAPRAFDPSDRADARFAVCNRNDDHPASLETRKLHPVVPDRDAIAHGMLRVIDESGEDYLHPADVFLLLALPREVEEALLSLR